MKIETVHDAKEYIKDKRKWILEDSRYSWIDFYNNLSGKVGIVTSFLYEAGYSPFEKLNCIPDYGYSGEYRLTSIDIPDSVDYLGSHAFYECSNLRNINWNNSIESIKENCFRHCISLVTVKVPDQVSSIDRGAFSFCASLTNIYLPNRLDAIPNTMCYNSTELKGVLIPSSVNSIGRYAFYNCHRLYQIQFDGSKEEWYEIIKHPEWNKNASIDRIICNNGVIVIE